MALRTAANQAVPFLSENHEELKTPKLAHMVADRLRSQIISGQLAPGSTLPTEGELLAIYKISRPTLREAMRVLEAENLINIGRGMRSGATVLGVSSDKVADYATILLASEGVTMLDLHQARSFFEPAIVRAFDEVDPAMVKTAVASLKEILERLRQAHANQDYARAVRESNRFHTELALSPGNKTMALLAGVLLTIWDEAYTGALVQERDSLEALNQNMTKAELAYGTLIGHLETGDFQAAEAFWRLYMQRSCEYMRRTRLGARQVVHKTMQSAG